MVEETVTIRDDRTALGGFLEIPSAPAGIVLFAHGSGSGRFSPRNRFVARQLQRGGIATLLIDLLMTDEEEDRRNVFDIDLLSDRVLMASAWLREDSQACHWATSVPAPGRHPLSKRLHKLLSASVPSSRAVGVLTSPNATCLK